MKLSLNWIKKYIDLPATLTMDQLSYDLTMRTVEVEGVIHQEDQYRHMVCGKILSIQAHPDADRLRILQLDVGKRNVQIVCGGKNLEEGHLVALALPGARVLWHGQGEEQVIEASQLRGVDSYGMVCGASEIGLGDLFPAKDHEILDLTEKGFSAQAGEALSKVLGLDDTILEIDNKSLTNRPDLWGHYGIARELSAIYHLPLKTLPGQDVKKSGKAYPLQVNDDRCRRFMALEYRNLDSRPSPFWMQRALQNVDVRPINAIVDITNFAMMTTGQPSHAYDAKQVGDCMIVRAAKEGEQLTLLDESECRLSPADLVVANQEEAMGLAGCMGGAKDSILPDTEEVVFEIGNFDAAMIRKTAQKFTIHTEASMRFEKGIDTQRADGTLAFANGLFHEIFPEVEEVAFADVLNQETEEKTISLSMSWLMRRLGREVTGEEVRELLKALGFRLELQEDGDEVLVHVPSWRSTGDVSLPDDILEEVARMIGYENFTLKAPQVILTAAVSQKGPTLDRRIREYLAFQCGFREIFTYPWIKDEMIEATGLDTASMLSLAQPPAPDQKYLRSSLIPGQLEAIVKNLRFFDAFRIFECTQVYEKGESHPSEERETLPAMHRELAGSIVSTDPVEAFYQMKGVLEQLGQATQSGTLDFSQEEKPSWADSNAWVNICWDGQRIGSMGLLSNRCKHQADLKFHDACVFQLDCDRLQANDSRTNHFTHLPQYPHVFQDLSVLLPEESRWDTVREAVAPMVESVAFVDEYRGEQIPEGFKSLTLRVELASREGTLTNKEIEARMQKVRQALEQVGAGIRTK